jgi:hypothetical protein
VGTAGFSEYFSIRFHYFEFVVVIQTVVEFFFYVPTHRAPVWVEALRMLRLVRIVKKSKPLQKLLRIGYKSLPATGNIGVVLVAMMYSFAMIGVALFQDVRDGFDPNNWFSPMFSMRTVPKAMFMLYSVATTDTWQQVEAAFGVAFPNCQPGYNCGNIIAANIFLNTFVIVITLVMFNLFVAVVLENFSDAVLLPHYLQVRQADVDSFRRAWSKFDSGRNIVNARLFVPLLQSLPGPEQRFEMLRTERENAKDNESIHSLETDEMRLYAETQTIGLGGCRESMIIPTLMTLHLPVTMPREEILYIDAIHAIGEKIYHATLVDERIRNAHKKIMRDASEGQVPFYQWYAVCRFQKLWRMQRLEMKKERAAYSASHLWNAVLDPIVQQFVKQHQRSAWTQENSASLRRVTLKKKTQGAAEDPELVKEKEKILDEAAKRDGKTLAETLKERQVEVEEAPEVKEDLLWMTAVENVEDFNPEESDDFDEDIPWLTSEGRMLRRQRWNELKLSRPGMSAAWYSRRLKTIPVEMPMRVDEHGMIFHFASLEEVQSRSQRDLLFQLRALRYRDPGMLPMEDSNTTTLQVRAALGSQAIDLDRWRSAAQRWAPRPPFTSAESVSPDTWRVQLGVPLYRRPLVQDHKKRHKTTVSHLKSEPKEAEWWIIYAAPISSSGGSNEKRREYTSGAQSRSRASSTLEPPVIASNVTLRSQPQRAPTLYEEMKRLGMCTALQDQKNELHRQNLIDSSDAQRASHESYLSARAPEPQIAERLTLKALLRSVNDPLDGQYDASACYSLPELHDVPEKAAAVEPASSFSFGALMAMKMAARRFKRKKEREQLSNLEKSFLHGSAARSIK